MDLSKPVNIKILWENVFILNWWWKQTNKINCNKFHVKQSSLKFRDQICFKKVFLGQNLRKKLSNSESALLCTKFYLEQSTLHFQDQICPKKIIWGQETIAECRIIILEYLHALSFIWSFGTRFDQQRYLGTTFRKIKSYSTFFWVSVKWLTKCWATVTESRS